MKTPLAGGWRASSVEGMASRSLALGEKISVSDTFSSDVLVSAVFTSVWVADNVLVDIGWATRLSWAWLRVCRLKKWSLPRGSSALSGAEDIWSCRFARLLHVSRSVGYVTTRPGWPAEKDGSLSKFYAEVLPCTSSESTYGRLRNCFVLISLSSSSFNSLNADKPQSSDMLFCDCHEQNTSFAVLLGASD